MHFCSQTTEKTLNQNTWQTCGCFDGRAHPHPTLGSLISDHSETWLAVQAWDVYMLVKRPCQVPPRAWEQMDMPRLPSQTLGDDGRRSEVQGSLGPSQKPKQTKDPFLSKEHLCFTLPLPKILLCSNLSLPCEEFSRRLQLNPGLPLLSSALGFLCYCLVTSERNWRSQDLWGHLCVCLLVYIHNFTIY